MDEEVLNVLGHLRLGARHLFGGQLEVGLYAVELHEQLVLHAGHQVAEVVIVLGGDGHDGRGLARDGVPQASALYRCQTGFVVDHSLFQNAEQLLDSIGALQVDIASRVTALATRQADAYGYVALFGLYGLEVERSGGVHAAGAAYVQFALGLRVEVEQVFAAQPSALEVERTVHAGLFIHGEQCLQRGMHGVLVGQDSHGGRNADTVVSAQSRTVGRYPLAVLLYIGLDGVFLKVEDAVVVLLRHHVHMALQDDTRMVFHAGRRRFADQHVADLVLQGLQTQALTVIDQEGSYFLFLSARTRNLC